MGFFARMKRLWDMTKEPTPENPIAPTLSVPRVVKFDGIQKAQFVKREPVTNIDRINEGYERTTDTI